MTTGEQPPLSEYEGPTWVRQCEHCGRLDLAARWRSPGDAESAGIWERHWECPACGGEDFVLADVPETS
jgi:hypothetical protein